MNKGNQSLSEISNKISRKGHQIREKNDITRHKIHPTRHKKEAFVQDIGFPKEEKSGEKEGKNLCATPNHGRSQSSEEDAFARPIIPSI